MQIRHALTAQEIEGAASIDEGVIGSRRRREYIASIAERGGLSVAVEDGQVVAFCCLDDRYFFEKKFVSLLVVRPESRRCGLGRGLLEFCGSEEGSELWTSTNRSNAAMQALLKSSAWHYCGELQGLDADDPELFFKK